jgi:hypothetical protein
VACTTPWTKTTSGEGNNVTVSSGNCADQVGNSNNAITSSGYHIDKTNPTVTCGTAPTFHVNQANAQVSGSVTDILSGPVLPSVSSSADTSLPGTHYATVTGYDNAGNSTAAACPYTVNYILGTGFLPPLDPNDTGTMWNVGNAGKTYPIKWQLTDANGSYITNAVSGTTISVAHVTCPNSTATTTDPIDYVSATGGTALRYDSTANQYIYNWQTPSNKGWCYKMTVSLPGGQVMISAFQMK